MSNYTVDTNRVEKTISVGPWPKGMNNRQPDYALPDGTLRNTINTDLDNQGYARRRAGYTKVVSAVGARGGFSCLLGQFFVQGSTLCKLNTDNSITTVITGLAGADAAYTFFNDILYFSDGAAGYCITASAVRPWGQRVPATPTTYTVAGTLAAGTYLVALTAVDSAGRESGASDISTLTLVAPGGIAISGCVSVGAATRVYMSMQNSQTMYAVADLPAGQTTMTATSGRLDVGRVLDSQFMVPPPAGRILRVHKGRMYIAQGSVLWYTDPYSLERVKVSGAYYQFTAPITVVESVSGGLWVVADQTYFYRGSGPDDFSVEQQLNYGAVYGTSQAIPNTNDVLWYSVRGVVVGTQDGRVENIQEAHVAADSGTVGASIIREKDGLRQMVATVVDPSASPLAASSYITMEVIRKGT